MGRRGWGGGRRAGGFRKQRVERERVEVMVGGTKQSYDPPGCV